METLTIDKCIATDSFQYIAKRILIVALTMMTMVISAMGAPVDTIFFNSHPYVSFVDSAHSASLIRLTDDDYLDKAGKIVFRINCYDAFANDTLFRQLENEVLPVVKKDSLHLARMILRVASSPEGSHVFNHQLSLKRAKVLTDFLCDRFAVPVDESVLDVEVVDEDYRLLCAMMRRASDPDLKIVQQLVDRYSQNNGFVLLQKELQKLDQGQLWQRLTKVYFPHLRAARLVLVFERPEIHYFCLPTPMPPRTDSVCVVPAVEMVQCDERVPRRELLSVKTNLLLDAAYVPFGYDRWCPIPNIAIEYYPKRGHFTFGASVDFPWWQHYWKHKYFELRNYQFETRYYFRSGDISKNPPGQGKAFRGFYLQGYVHAGIYCISLNVDRGYVGEAFGGGIGFGYVMPLGKKSRWRLEFGAQIGYIHSLYDPFQFEYRGSVDLQDHLYYYDWTLPAAEFKKRQYRFNWFGPTRVGVTISYDLLYRRKAKRGISFKSYEWQERRGIQ